MTRKIVLAFPTRDYAGRLAEYLRETEPGWDTAAFTHEAALRLRLQEAAAIDLLVGHPSLLRQVTGYIAGTLRVAALVEQPGMAEGVWPELNLFQPLPAVAAGLHALLADAATVSPGGCRLLTVFSAAGGAGKTTTALNIARQAGERGWRTFYFNMETLNATSRLFGAGEPDSLSRLLYGLQTDPGRFPERLAQSVRHHPYLRADFVDAPDHPGERSAMTPELLEHLVNAIRETGRYDLIVADPDSGIGDWHRKLLTLSDRIVWLVTDDWQSMDKADRLLSHWREETAEWAGRLAFVRNKAHGESAIRWRLSSQATAVLPYVSEWKSMDQPEKLFGSAAFCGAVDRLFDVWGWDRRRKEDKLDGGLGTVRRGTG